MTNSYTATIKTNIKNKNDVFQSLYKQYPHATLRVLPDRENISRIVIHTKSYDTRESFEHEIKKIKEITAIDITTNDKNALKVPKKYSLFLLLGLAAFAVLFTIITFSTSEDFLTNSQAIIIEILIAMLIAGVIFKLQNKWQNEIGDMLKDIDILASEIREYVSDREKTD